MTYEVGVPAEGSRCPARRGCKAFADGADHLGMVRFNELQYDGAADTYIQALQARQTCLLLIDAGRDTEGKGGLEERHAALMELEVTLFYRVLLRKNQDRIAEAVVYCKEALRAWREIVPDTRDDFFVKRNTG